jgi:hypothetical protein
MFKNQKGLLPFLCKVAGLIIVVYPTFIILVNSVYEIFSSSTLIDIVARSIATGLVLLFPISIGWFLLNLFPGIKMLDVGIKYMSSPISTRLVRWDEIESLCVFKNGYGALIIQKKGLSIFNGLYFNKIYGLMTGILDPVIFLAPSTLGNADLINKLREKGKILQ